MKIFALLLLLPLFVFATESVDFLSPRKNETVKSPFKVKMNVSGKKVRAAGEAPDDKTTGHHHLIIDGGFIPQGQVIPSDEKHLHFGKGQTETEVKLSAGEHSLTLQFADGAHRSYGEPLSKTIKIKVR